MRLTAAQRAALAAIGRIGGKATGPRKARSKEHYARMADAKRMKAKKRKETET